MTSEVFEKILQTLPQTQCGQCGYDGCEPYAKAIAEGTNSNNLCPPGGEEVWQKLCAITNKKETEPPREHSAHRVYIDVEKCIGCYKCIRACPVNAIVGAPKHLHQVNLAFCTGCDLCLPACPVDCIHEVKAKDTHIQYHHPELIFADRRTACLQHTKVTRRSLKTTKIKPQNTNSLEASEQKKTYIKDKLNKALERAKLNNDQSAIDRISDQLQKIEIC